MRKSISRIAAFIAILIAAIIIYSIYWFFSDLFSRTNKGKLKAGKCVIHADYVPGNATVQYVLQIRTDCGSEEVFLVVKEGFSSVESMRQLNDSLIEVIAGDSTFSFARDIDTLAIPECCK